MTDGAEGPLPPPPDPPAPTYHLAVDDAGVVRSKCRSNADQPDMVSVDRPTYDAAAIGTTRLVASPPAADGSVSYTVEPYAPPPPPPPAPPRVQLGGVFLAAVNDLGWWGWMDQGAAAQAAPAPNGPGKPLDQRYWSSLGKADLVIVSDAKLVRVARAAEAARVAASGQPAPAAPVITMAAAMDHGDAMTAAAAKGS